jgi:hypothetical protein
VSAPTMRPWRLTNVSQPLDTFAPVLALTLVRRRGNDLEDVEVLTGARTAAANRTHPGVVSVPTRRVPVPIAQPWLDHLGTGVPDSLRYEVENVLARKLGVADALELGTLDLTVHDLHAWQGTSVIGEDDDGLRTEDLTMFNACVEITAGADDFPEQTASYRPIRWASTDNFLRMVRTKEVGALEVGFDELMFCAYGLCLETAARVLTGRSWPACANDHRGA